MKIDDSWYVRPDQVPQRAAAGGVIVRRDGEQLLIALASEPDRPGYILPKGKVRPGETIVEAGRREIQEEIGLTDLDEVCELATAERLSFDKSRWTVTTYFLFLTSQVTGKPTDRKRQYNPPAWFSLDQLPDMFWPEQRRLVEQNVGKIAALVKEHVGAEAE